MDAGLHIDQSTHLTPSSGKMGSMAGPGRPGPARKGWDEVEYLKLKGRVLSLYADGRTHTEIASVTGLERSAVTKMIPRAKRDVLTDNEQTLEALFLQSRDLDELGQQLIQRIISDESGPSHRDIKAMVEILRAKRRLFPPDLLWPPGTNLPLLSEDVELTGDREFHNPQRKCHIRLGGSGKTLTTPGHPVAVKECPPASAARRSRQLARKRVPTA